MQRAGTKCSMHSHLTEGSILEEANVLLRVRHNNVECLILDQVGHIHGLHWVVVLAEHHELRGLVLESNKPHTLVRIRQHNRVLDHLHARHIDLHVNERNACQGLVVLETSNYHLDFEKKGKALQRVSTNEVNARQIIVGFLRHLGQFVALYLGANAGQKVSAQRSHCGHRSLHLLAVQQLQLVVRLWVVWLGNNINNVENVNLEQ